MENLVKTQVSVKTEILASKDRTKTFSITKEIDGIEGGGHAYFILLYPTRTADNAYIEDSTNNHLLNHLNDLGLKSYTIINLFSKVTQSRLSLSGLEIDEDNMKYIQEQVFAKSENDSKVIIAWGNTQQNSPVIMKSKQRILTLWERERPSEPLYQLTADGLTKENLGTHPLYMGIRYSQACWKLASYPHKRILKEIGAQIEARENRLKDSALKPAKKNIEAKSTANVAKRRGEHSN